MKSSKAARAARVLLSKKEAVDFCRSSKTLNSDSFIEVRYATRTRCDKYCQVNSVCNHYQTYLQKLKTNTLNERIPMDLILNGRWL